MINSLYFGIGFIIYVIYILITFKTYSKKKKINNKFIYILIFIYYSILAGYLINLIDNSSSIEKRIIEILIYIICGGIVILFNYNVSIKKDENLDWSE